MTYRASQINASTSLDLKDRFAGQTLETNADYADIDPQRCIDIRASVAARTVLAYCEHSAGAQNEEMTTVIADLLGDLHHLCDGLGIDFDHVVNLSDRYYTEEIAGH